MWIPGVSTLWQLNQCLLVMCWLFSQWFLFFVTPAKVSQYSLSSRKQKYWWYQLRIIEFISSLISLSTAMTARTTCETECCDGDVTTPPSSLSMYLTHPGIPTLPVLGVTTNISQRAHLLESTLYSLWINHDETHSCHNHIHHSLSLTHTHTFLIFPPSSPTVHQISKLKRQLYDLAKDNFRSHYNIYGERYVLFFYCFIIFPQQHNHRLSFPRGPSQVIIQHHATWGRGPI